MDVVEKEVESFGVREEGHRGLEGQMEADDWPRRNQPNKGIFLNHFKDLTHGVSLETQTMDTHQPACCSEKI